MRKRITSLLLTLAMLLSLLPAMGVTASAAADDTSYVQAEIRDYNTFASYLRSFDSRDLKLTKDINYTVGIDDDSIYVMRNQKLDLNGHKITIDASKRAGFENLLCIRRGEFTLYDSSKGGGGELAVSFPNDDKAYSIIMMSSEKKDEPSKFTMNGGTLTKLSPNMTYTYGASGCIGDDYFNKPENGKRSQITINGGTINCSYAYKWDRSKPLLSLPVEAMPLALQLFYSNLTINGGTFNGIVWTDLLWRGKQDTEPRVVLNGGVFNAPFVVEDMQRTATQMVIDGAHFNDGFYVDDGDSKNTDVGTVPQLLLKSGVFDSPDKNPKLDIYNVTAAHGDSSITKNRVILHAMKCFPNSAIKVNGNIYTSENINSLVKSNDKGYYLKLNSNTPIEVIRDAWGVMESVTLDGTKTINYAKDWKGAVEEMDNSTAHTIKFEWKDLAQALKDAGYSYRIECDRYISGSKTSTTDTISDSATEYSFTIPAGADPKVYSFDLKLNLKKGDKNIGIISNEHIVKLVVNQAPVVVPDPTLTGKVYYTSGIVFGRSISTGTGNLPTGFDSSKLRYQWQRSTDSGNTWKNIEGETRGSYTPVEADMGENVRIRVKITANGYLGEIVGAAVKVSKADNNGYPAVIQLEAMKDGEDKYTSFKINNYDPNCEYVYNTTDTPNWSEYQISSDTVTGLVSNTTYYVFARFKGTATHTAGSIVSKNSIKLYDNVPLQYVLLEGYNSGEKIYIKKGESVTLKVSADPSNANSWSEITFKDEGATTSNIAISNGTINASTGTATPFPNGQTITITGVSTGSANLRASYPSATSSAYGTWNVVVYDDSTVANALRLENVYTYADITLSENDEAELPTETELPKLLPENSGYHLDWRITKVGSGAAYSESDENIELVGGKIKPIKAHAESEKTRLDLVAVNGTTVKSLSPSSVFYVTVTKAPTIALTGLTVAPKKVNLEKVNDTCQLSAVKEPVNAAGTLEWKSSNTDVATVDGNGKVTAVAKGEATITVTCGDKTATCTVTVAHTHDYTGQPWVYMDPGTHTKTCTAGDNFKAEAHTFSAWKKVDDTNHSRTCTVCNMTDGSVYTETASHNWQWVVDTHATSTTAGKKHEECPDCHAKRNENTVIPATGGGSSSGGGGGGGAGVTTYAITVQNSKNGAVTASHKSAAKDTAVTLTVTPDKGYVLDTLTVLDSKDKAVKLTEKNGKYTFTMPSGKVTVSAAFKAAAPASENPFTDVPSGAYYEDAVIWAVKKGITSGTSATTFNPDGSCTRAQAVTFLWRAAGSPEPKSVAMPFTDVPAGSYFEKAVLWAVENGITKGTSDTTFSPDASCTRAQIVTFLWRAGGSPAVSGNSAFSDVASDVYYAAAVAWAEKNGVTGGIGGGLFGSDNTCTRAQIVTFLHRAMK